LTTCCDLNLAGNAAADGRGALSYSRINPQGTPHAAGIGCMNSSILLPLWNSLATRAANVALFRIMKNLPMARIANNALKIIQVS
jgi:hypothetical protein